MSNALLILLIAFAAATGCYGIAQILSTLTGGDRRKLKQRLSSAGAYTATSDQPAVSLYLAERPQESLFARFKLVARFQQNFNVLYPNVRLNRFLMLCAGLAVAGAILGFAFTGFIFLTALAAALLGVTPLMALNAKRKHRQRLLAEQLPETLEFLSRVLRAGHSLSTGIQMVGTELPDPLAAEFRRAYDQHSVGISLEQALRDMAARIRSTDFAFFVTATLIQRQTGGDLAHVLSNISNMVRQRLRLKQQVRAKTAEGRFTGYILSAFPAVMFLLSYMLNPAYASQLLGNVTGVTLLCVAVGLEVVGLLAIKTITTVRV